MHTHTCTHYTHIIYRKHDTCHNAHNIIYYVFISLSLPPPLSHMHAHTHHTPLHTTPSVASTKPPRSWSWRKWRHVQRGILYPSPHLPLLPHFLPSLTRTHPPSPLYPLHHHITIIRTPLVLVISLLVP